MPFQPTYPKPYNEGVNIKSEDGVSFECTVDEYDTIISAELRVTDVNSGEQLFALNSQLDKQYSKIDRQLEFDTHFVVNFQKRILSQLTYRVESTKLSVNHTVQNISARVQNAFVRKQMQLDAATNKLSSVNPINILKRGYAFVEFDGAPIKSVNQLQVGDNLTIHVADGNVLATVTDKESK